MVRFSGVYCDQCNSFLDGVKRLDTTSHAEWRPKSLWIVGWLSEDIMSLHPRPTFRAALRIPILQPLGLHLYYSSAVHDQIIFLQPEGVGGFRWRE